MLKTNLTWLVAVLLVGCGGGDGAELFTGGPTGRADVPPGDQVGTGDPTPDQDAGGPVTDDAAPPQTEAAPGDAPVVGGCASVPALANACALDHQPAAFAYPDGCGNPVERAGSLKGCVVSVVYPGFPTHWCCPPI